MTNSCLSTCPNKTFKAHTVNIRWIFIFLHQLLTQNRLRYSTAALFLKKVRICISFNNYNNKQYSLWLIFSVSIKLTFVILIHAAELVL